MIQGMTGFGNREKAIAPFGKASVELRSTNHKFFETVFHLPEGLLSLEERIKKEIESKIKRGRITCVINILGGKNSGIFIDKTLLKKYMTTLKNIKGQFRIKDEISINTLIHLPGVISLETDRVSAVSIWPHLKVLVKGALEDLSKLRRKEGVALHGFLKARADSLLKDVTAIKARYKKTVEERLKQIVTDEERSGFLKDTDISEEIERLTFHIGNFRNKLSKNGPVGKELDFIAQELQREANTLAAKSFDTSISARVVEIKSQVEKIREQVQNIE